MIIEFEKDGKFYVAEKEVYDRFNDKYTVYEVQNGCFVNFVGKIISNDFDYAMDNLFAEKLK